MKATRLISMIICTLLFFSVNGMAQGFLEGVLKAAGDAAIDEAVDGIKGKKSNKKTPSTKKVTGFKVVSPHPDLNIEIKSCKATGKTAVIDMIITNNGKDVSIELMGGYNYGYAKGTEVFDDEGNIYSEANVLVSIAGNSLEKRGNTSKFPSDIPIKCRLQIETVEESAQTFKRIDFKIHSKELSLNDDKPILIHNIPIERQD